MTPVIIIIVAVLLAGAWLLRREIRRAPLMPPDYDRPAQPMNSWQAGIKPDRRTDYGQGAAGADPLDKLRQENLRQKPQEGRN